jgi:hypothetical protein
VEKYIAYTIPQAQQVIKNIHAPNQVNSVLLHLITNDVEHEITAATVTRHAMLVDNCYAIFPNAQVFISLGVNRLDNSMLNNRITVVNNQLSEMFYDVERTVLIENSSLSINRYPIGHFFSGDGVHLSQSGTAFLAAHFRAALEGNPTILDCNY